MDNLSEFAPIALMGDADPVPQSLFASFPEQAKTLTLLYDVSRELTSILDREELLRRIAQRVKKIVDYHVFTVLLWNDATEYLEGVFAMHYDASIPSRFRVRLNQGITGTAAGERRAMRLHDVRDDPRYIQCETGIEVRSELVVPVLLQDRLVGVLDLESTAPGAFTTEHERMLGALAPYIAIALENAKLFHQARENERRLLEDLDTAREIQRQLLPTGAREVPGLELAASYSPARELGGDFYDFLPYGGGRLAMALGDVSGKGTGAALFGSLAIGMLREHVVEHPCQPAEMLAMLNRRLHSARLDSRFIAMMFAIYDASSRRLRLSNAGGPYPLLVRDGVVQEFRVEGVPLGLLPDSTYDEIEVQLVPGDVLFFASDGILEAENRANQQFGAQQLAAVLHTTPADLGANAIAAEVLRATDEHAGPGNAPRDDRTLVVLRVLDETPSANLSKLPVIY